MDEHLRQPAAIVALLRSPSASWPHIVATVIERGDAVELLAQRLTNDRALAGVGDPVDAVLEAAVSDIRGWQARGIGVHCCLDEAYPEQLRDIHQVPPVVFTRGRLCSDRRAVAVVGTRHASPRGIAAAETIAASLAQAGITVVSGLAAGIGTAVHRAALGAGGRTVAVIGTGINHCHPAGNEALQMRIAEDGLVLSPLWPDTPPTTAGLRLRSAVMSGYAAATVMVEATYRSGTRRQARLALEHGRPVILPGELLQQDWARQYASRPGVYVVDGIDELLATVEALACPVLPVWEVFDALAHRAAL